jgi:hypothetical protein
MSHLNAQNSMRPLSVGNVVSAGIRLYRSHLKLYLSLALRAYLWILLPIYGWAKFSAISALISRLAFSELVNQPETVKPAENQVNSRMWSFLVAGILVSLIVLAALVGCSIVGGILFGLVAVLIGNAGVNLVLIAFAVLLGIGGVIAFLGALIWIYSRFIIAELPLAIENNIDAVTTISRSWELTKGYVVRIQAIVMVAFLITLPFQIVVQVVIAVLQPAKNAPPLLGFVLALLILALSLLSGALVLPFWQAIKAVIYYDLRTRREGLGLQLREPTDEEQRFRPQ